MSKPKTIPSSLSKPKKAITIKEIKFWLEGISEFQDAGWVPNSEQWRTIKDKIMSLKEEPVSQFVHNHTNNFTPQPQPVSRPLVDVEPTEPSLLRSHSHESDGYHHPFA